MEPEEYEIFEKNGDRYLRIFGRRGRPIRMQEGETADDTVARNDARRAAAGIGDGEPVTDIGSDGQDGETGGFRFDDPTQRVDEPQSPGTDPRPKRIRRRRVRNTGPSTAALGFSLAQIMSLPAIPMATIVKCEACANHFNVEGPKAANEIAKLSERNPALRAILLKIHEADAAFGYATAIGMYIAFPVIHHLAPSEIRTSPIGMMLRVPANEDDLRRAAETQQQHKHAHPQAA